MVLVGLRRTKTSSSIWSTKHTNNSMKSKKRKSTAASRGTKTAAQLKKELDAIFSKYIRLSFADKDGFVICYTCTKRFFWRQIQNGHFIRRQYLATRFDKRNCRPQCVGCNIFGDGKTVEFAAKLEKETPGIVKILYREAQKIVKGYPYAEEIALYKEKVKKLARDLGLELDRPTLVYSGDEDLVDTGADLP